MLIVIGYDLPDKIYNDIAEKDMHGSDVLDLINEVAIDLDYRHHVWHLSSDAEIEFDDSMNALFEKFSTPKTKEVLNAEP